MYMYFVLSIQCVQVFHAKKRTQKEQQNCHTRKLAEDSGNPNIRFDRI